MPQRGLDTSNKTTHNRNHGERPEYAEYGQRQLHRQLDAPPHLLHMEQDPQQSDVRRINNGISRSEFSEFPLDDATARLIAAQLHDGQASAMYSFASCGAIDIQRLMPELTGTELAAKAVEDGQTTRWAHALMGYIMGYGNRGAVKDWHLLTAEQQQQAKRERIAIWLGCLAAYNAGELHGEWVDAAQSPEQLEDAAKAILARSPEPDAEEHFIADHDGFMGVKVHEYDDLANVSRLANALQEHGPALAEYVRASDDQEEALDTFAESFQGEYMDTEQYGDSLARDLGLERLEDLVAKEAPGIAPYFTFDVEQFVRDMQTNGELLIVQKSDFSGVYIYRLR